MGMSRVASRWETDGMPKGHLPLVYRACPTIEVLQARTQLETARAQAIDLSVQWTPCEHAIATLLGKPPADGVADTMITVFDHLAKHVSTRRGCRPAPHPSPAETT
jgi:hypothetical protein